MVENLPKNDMNHWNPLLPMLNETLRNLSQSNNTGEGITFDAPFQPSRGTSIFTRKIPCAFPLIPEYDYVTLTMGIVTILLNGFVFTLFCTHKSLRRLSGNYILASLSVNDLFNGMFMLYNLIPQFYLHDNDCPVNQFKLMKMELPTIGRTIYRSLMLSSVLHLVILSTDRLVYVFHALTYDTMVTKHKIIKFLSASWFCCVTCSSIQLLWSLRDGPLNINRKVLKFYHTLLLAVLFIGLPSIILMVQSIAMVLMIRKLETLHFSNTMAGRRAFLLYIIMYLKFVLFSYPYFILSLIFEISPQFFKEYIPIMLIRILLIARFIPCLVNPCLYSLKNRDYRRAIKRIVRKLWPSLYNKELNSEGFNKRGSCRMTIIRGSEETSV
ncbi:melanocortin receptor 4-like [Clytia hemisphaerica]|uniref:melanocortin receptor 4-like n=1 Tax=Clytia hemisphaerica TaxID=252671 RepID=UPI0034D69A66